MTRPRKSRRPARSPVHEAQAGGNWLTIAVPEVTAPAEAAEGVPAMDEHASSGAPRTGEAEPVSTLLESLGRLDSVVNDFIASLDQTSLPAPANGKESENIARFMRILAAETAPGSPVLGPPVLCGVTPPVHLESVFGFLGTLRKTGILRLQADDMTFMISVVEGDVVHGVSSKRPADELLGNILVERGAIGSLELEQFFSRCGSSACTIGEAINRQELVKTEALREALEIQLQRLFDRLLAARAAEWCFHEGEAKLAYITLRMSPIRVLLENARKRDEENAARTSGSGDAALSQLPPDVQPSLA